MELGDALAHGFRYDPMNKPPLRPGCTVRLRKGNEHTLVRIESEEDVEALKASVSEYSKYAAAGAILDALGDK